MTDHLEESVRASFRNLISPAAIGFTVATTVAIAGVSVASGGTAVPVIIAIGYALVGWAIFNAVGDLIDTFLLVYNATDERDLDRAATKLASAAAELTVGVLITLLTRGAGRLGVGGKSRSKFGKTEELETVPSSREGVQVAVDTEGQVYKFTEKTTSDDRPIFETQSGGSTAHTVLDDIPSGNAGVSTSTHSELTETVWDNVTATANNLPNTHIPATFRLKSGDMEFYVNSNATKHMGEYLQNSANPLNDQTLLRSFSSVVDRIASNGSIQFGKMYNIDGWEIIFSQRDGDLLPVVKHALYRP
ncbi:hypothetical protein [Aestuariispira ectoiniformans]|uniref:hypothetical protein n=1 Tax=Aestuariispira ectoiniformans TaxID=2775080 RepID=UPI00223BC048|nr:hypothetical protein [Aestuariispira ectoiniformans]